MGGYAPTTWVDEGPPPLDAAHLQKIETGILNAVAKGALVFNIVDEGAVGDDQHDDGPAIEAANIKAHLAGGIVFFPPPKPGGRYRNTITHTISRIDVAWFGASSGAVVINHIGTGDCVRVLPAVFSVVQAGFLRGITISGTSAAIGAGLHMGDVVGFGLDDIVIENFTHANGSALWLDNTTHWTERINMGRVWLNNSTETLRLTVNGGQNSFGYQSWLDLRINVSTGQTAISTENGYLYHSRLRIITNGTGTPTFWTTGGTFLAENNLYELHGEATSAGAIRFNIATGTAIRGIGQVDLGANWETDTLPSPAFGGSLRILQPTAINGPTAADQGSFANFHGTGNSATPEMVAVPDLSNPYGQLGFLLGPNIISLYMSIYNQTGNSFSLFAQNFGEIIDADDEFFAAYVDGTTRTKAQVYPGDEARALQSSGGLLHSIGVPSNANGNPNDWCISDNGHLYFKSGGAWVQKI
jgi:hypothetical protein